jgi:signal transduction histidine kinase/ActR/RegA family two-component response regulator
VTDEHGVGPGEVDQRALAAALRAALEVQPLADLCRAILREVSAAVPLEFAAVLRLSEAGAEVVGLFPGASAGLEVGLRWEALDATERELLRLGEPMLESTIRLAPTDRSPLTRLPAYGVRSVLRVPLFQSGRVVGAVLAYSTRESVFTARHGLTLEASVNVIGRHLSPVSDPAVLFASAPAEEIPVREAVASVVDHSSNIERTEAPVALQEPARPVDTAPERLSVLGELVSGVAHELNNPLTTILGYAQLLPSLDGDELRHATSTIEQEAQRAGRIVRNLLYSARQHRPRVEPVNINVILERVIEVRRYNLEANGITIEAQLGPVPELLGDQYQLEQVFLNLVTNAQQALGHGGTIFIVSEQIGDTVRVSVTDTGPGVPEEIVSRIFEPFFTTREVGEGTGLGLSIAYGIVQAHQGRLTAERAAAGGVRFVVELPLPEQVQRPFVSEPGAERGHGERVLVVEDEPTIRSLVTTILGGSGYAVMSAESGAEALQALHTAVFDLVIADVRMPGMGGEALYATVSQHWPHLRRRLLFISGDVESDRLSELVRAGDVRYLEKPFTAAALLRATRELLDAEQPESPAPIAEF